jgi:hypothetical protein
LGAVRSESKTDFKILPFVVLLEREPRLKLNKAELEAFIWVLYEEVIQSKNHGSVQLRKGSRLHICRWIVWGITYNILSELVEALEALQ